MAVNGPSIRAIREAAHRRQGEVAEAVGITQGALSNIEAGRDQPSDELVAKIAQELGIRDLAAIVWPEQ